MGSENGILRKPSGLTVDEVVRKLLGTLADKGVKVFAVVDHSGEAEKVGLHMPPTKLLIFGNPKGGTPAYAGVAERRHRLAHENPGCGR